MLKAKKMNQDEKPAVDSPSDEMKKSEPRINLRRIIKELAVFLRHRLSLEDDNADPADTIEYIKKGVEFKGTNIWILIFAILIASIGLNMNSAAVIIGAMLISPLMGPIMGLGMGVGTNDFALIKKAAKNLGIMVGISVITSTIYFFLTPLSDAQSELLARTTPTIWDVMIALFGGLAGIVAGSRREKSNAIPGVAIATALMPPLCTAGYGIATGNLAYFAGAFYLFTINSVFISLSTIIIVRFLRYPTKSFVDTIREKRVKRWIAIIVVLVTLPSFWIAFNLVKKVFLKEKQLFS
ncbi:TIGR00341 family protein [Salibacteraceae bacterium]|nr:TIGR00341 family protein [Salibacteraceae bacterium]